MFFCKGFENVSLVNSRKISAQFKLFKNNCLKFILKFWQNKFNEIFLQYHTKAICIHFTDRERELRHRYHIKLHINVLLISRDLIPVLTLL